MKTSEIKVLYSNSDISNRIKQIAIDIKDKYSSSDEIVIVGLLNGCFIFTSDLVREIDRDLKIDFMTVSSYGDKMESSGVINIKMDISIDIKDKNVIIVDDIIDTGNTLFEIKKYLESKKPKHLEICCLLDKKEKRKRDIVVNYSGFVCPDKFVVGYGMDASGKFRNLPYIGYI